MTKFRKKPIVVEATQWFKPGDHLEAVQVLESCLGFRPEKSEDEKRCISSQVADSETYGVNTLEGFMTITPGDWIVTGVEGEHYPVKPSIFEKIYEPC